MTLGHLARRTAEVYRCNGVRGVTRQAAAKLQHLYNVSTFRPHVIHKSLAGHEMKVAINNLFAKGWVEKRHEWPELEWVSKHMLRAGDIAVDCGANNGFTTVFFAKCVGPAGRVIAFEPLPRNAADVRQNIEINDLKNVDLRQAAVGRCSGEATMLDAPNGVLMSEIGLGTTKVTMTSLDEALDGIRPSFIKIDVEGHELEVLRGAQQALAHRPFLDIEVHPIFHQDREGHIRAVLAEIDMYEYHITLQPWADGPIIAWREDADLIPELSQSVVFHLFLTTHI